MNAPEALLAAFADEACPLAGALADYRAAALRAARLEHLRETDARPETETVHEHAVAKERDTKAAATRAVAEFYGVEMPQPVAPATLPLATDWESSIGITDWSKGREAA